MKIIRDAYAVKFRVMSIDMDAAYFYSPGRIDLVVIHKGFENDDRLVAQFITHLQREIELKKRAVGKTTSLMAHCIIGDLDLEQQPDFIIRESEDLEEIEVPGGEIVFIGRASRRPKTNYQAADMPPPFEPFPSDYSHIQGLADPDIIELLIADDRRRRQEGDYLWDDDVDDLQDDAF